jgi:hypothetical protein
VGPSTLEEARCERKHGRRRWLISVWGVNGRWIGKWEPPKTEEDEGGARDSRRKRELLEEFIGSGGIMEATGEEEEASPPMGLVGPM